MLIYVFVSLVPLCFKEYYTALLWVDRVTTVLFIVDYILRWITADYRCKKIRWFGVPDISVYCVCPA